MISPGTTPPGIVSLGEHEGTVGFAQQHTDDAVDAEAAKALIASALVCHNDIRFAVLVYIGDYQAVSAQSARFIGMLELEGPVAVAQQYSDDTFRETSKNTCLGHNDIERSIAIQIRKCH